MNVDRYSFSSDSTSFGDENRWFFFVVIFLDLGRFL